MIDTYFLNLPLTPYEEVLELQRAAVSARCSGLLEQELIILVEHPPVFTLGRRGGLENLKVDQAMLEEKGISVQSIERGGNITYHGPGQLVAYPIINIKAARKKVVEYVAALEKAMVQTVSLWGILAKANPANRGAWVGRRKLGSIGITIRRGVSFHGLALNVNTDLSLFQWMHPCGIKDCKVTSVAHEIGRKVSMETARHRLRQDLVEILGLNPIEVDQAFVNRLIESGDKPFHNIETLKPRANEVLHSVAN